MVITIQLLITETPQCLDNSEHGLILSGIGCDGSYQLCICAFIWQTDPHMIASCRAKVSGQQLAFADRGGIHVFPAG